MTASVAGDGERGECGHGRHLGRGHVVHGRTAQLLRLRVQDTLLPAVSRYQAPQDGLQRGAADGRHDAAHGDQRDGCWPWAQDVSFRDDGYLVEHLSYSNTKQTEDLKQKRYMGLNLLTFPLYQLHGTEE